MVERIGCHAHHMDKCENSFFERGLLFRNGEFRRLLPEGYYRLFSLTDELHVDVLSLRDPWIVHRDLDLLIKADALRDQATLIELTDTQRALVWIDGRFDRILGPGRYAYWHGYRTVRIEIVDTSQMRFAHPELSTILNTAGTSCN